MFPEFDEQNVAADIADMGGPVLVGLDFNVSIYGRCRLQVVGDTLHHLG